MKTHKNFKMDIGEISFEQADFSNLTYDTLRWEYEKSIINNNKGQSIDRIILRASTYNKSIDIGVMRDFICTAQDEYYSFMVSRLVLEYGIGKFSLVIDQSSDDCIVVYRTQVNDVKKLMEQKDLAKFPINFDLIGNKTLTPGIEFTNVYSFKNGSYVSNTVTVIEANIDMTKIINEDVLKTLNISTFVEKMGFAIDIITDIYERSFTSSYSTSDIFPTFYTFKLKFITVGVQYVSTGNDTYKVRILLRHDRIHVARTSIGQEIPCVSLKLTETKVKDLQKSKITGDVISTLSIEMSTFGSDATSESIMDDIKMNPEIRSIVFNLWVRALYSNFSDEQSVFIPAPNDSMNDIRITTGRIKKVNNKYPSFIPILLSEPQLFSIPGKINSVMTTRFKMLCLVDSTMKFFALMHTSSVFGFNKGILTDSSFYYLCKKDGYKRLYQRVYSAGNNPKFIGIDTAKGAEGSANTGNNIDSKFFSKIKNGCNISFKKIAHRDMHIYADKDWLEEKL